MAKSQKTQHLEEALGTCFPIYAGPFGSPAYGYFKKEQDNLNRQKSVSGYPPTLSRSDPNCIYPKGLKITSQKN